MTEPFYDRGIEFEFKEGADGASDSGDFVPSGKLLAMIRNHLIASEVKAAMELYQSCAQDIGDELVSGLLSESTSVVKSLARMFMDARDFRRAGACFEKLDDPQRAAKLYEQAGAFDLAAKLFEGAQDFKLAGQMMLRAGKHAEAGRLFDQAGHGTQAGEAYELGNDFLSAGRAYAKAGAEQRAVGLLQKVDLANPGYPEARLMLGTVLSRLGQFDLAARAFAEAIVRYPLPPQYGAEIAYRLGRIYLKLGDAARARVALEHANKVSPGYRDVAQQLQLVGSAAAVAKPTPVPLRSAPAAPVKSTQPWDMQPKPIEPAIDLEGSASQGPVVGRLDGFEHLKALPLARDLSLDHLRLLYAQCEHATFAPRDLLIKEGVPGEALFIVREGTLQVVVGGKVVAELGPGSCVGEMALIDDAPTSANVYAKTPVVAFRLGKDRFQRLLVSHATIALPVYRVFVETVVARLRTANQQLRGK